jgi:hypothetical protein
LVPLPANTCVVNDADDPEQMLVGPDNVTLGCADVVIAILFDEHPEMLYHTVVV